MKKLLNIFKKKVPEKANKRVSPPSGDASVPSSGKENEEKLSLFWLPHLASVLVVAAIAVVMGWHFNKVSTIKQIEVNGNLFTEATEIVEAMAIQEGNHADSLDFLKILENVEAMPYVKQAFITRTPSGEIKMRVQEREPVVLLIEQSRRTYVDADGIRMPMEAGKSVDVPLLYANTAELNADTLKGEIYTSVNRFLTAANEHDSAQMTISEIAWFDTEGIVAVSHDKGRRLVFGKENFENRINKWMTFYTGKVLNEGVANMDNIDLRFEGQIVTR
ncbi:MAG: FtsQ-type POTRA domain-containing protein [Balneolales bacterium]